MCERERGKRDGKAWKFLLRTIDLCRGRNITSDNHLSLQVHSSPLRLYPPLHPHKISYANRMYRCVWTMRIDLLREFCFNWFCVRKTITVTFNSTIRTSWDSLNASLLLLQFVGSFGFDAIQWHRIQSSNCVDVESYFSDVGCVCVCVLHSTVMLNNYGLFNSSYSSSGWLMGLCSSVCLPVYISG